jgi:hypothetical protein
MKIYMWDESSDAIVESQAELNLKTGKISNVVYVPLHDFFNQKESESPFISHDYEQTTGSVNINNKDIIFKVDISTSAYAVEPKELEKLHKVISDMGLNLDDLEPNSKKIKP